MITGRRALAVALAALALAGCGGGTTTTVTGSSGQKSGLTGGTGSGSGSTGSTSPQDQSQSIASDMMSSSKLESFLLQGYQGSSIQVTNAQCVESGSTQNYSCLASYSVSGASDPTQDGSYQIGASATCDNSGNCQWKTDALGTANKQGSSSGQSGSSGSGQTGSSGSAASTTACDQNVSASLSASCPFAENVFYEFYKQYGGNTPPSGGTIQAYSPTTSQKYTLQCSDTAGQITCTNESDPSAVVTFPESAVQSYTPALAAQYAASANLGP